MFKWKWWNKTSTTTTIPTTYATPTSTIKTLGVAPVTTINGNQRYVTISTVNWQYTTYIYCECCYKGVEIQTPATVGTRYKFFCSDECWEIYRTTPDLED